MEKFACQTPPEAASDDSNSQDTICDKRPNTEHWTPFHVCGSAELTADLGDLLRGSDVGGKL